MRAQENPQVINDDVPPQRSRYRIWFRVGMGIVLLCVLTVVILSMRTGNRLQSEMDWLADHGEPTTGAELLERYPKLEADAVDAGGLYGRASNIIRTFSAGPTVSNVIIFDKSLRLELEPNEAYPEEVLSASRAFVELNAQAISIMDRGDGLKPAAVGDLSEGLKLMLSSMSAYRTTAEFRALQMEMAAEAGDGEGVVAAVRSIAAMDRHLAADVHMLITHLVRTAIQGLAVQHIERAVNRATLSDEQLTQLMQLIEPWLDSRDLPDVYRAERVYFLETADEGFPWYWDAVGIRSAVMAEYLSLLRRAQEYAAEPLPKRLALMQTLENPQQRDPFVPDAMMDELSGVFLRPALLDAKVRAQVRAAYAALAMQRYRLQHSTIPDSMESLVPAFLPGQIIDPFTGKPLLYLKRETGGFIVYSTGEDGQDHRAGESNAETENQTSGEDISFRILQ